MIHVLAEITAYPGKRQEILEVLHSWIPGTLPEKGCLEYTVAVDADVVGSVHSQTKYGPDSFTIIEKWESLAHLEAHSSAPDVAEYFSVVGHLIANRVVHFLHHTKSYRGAAEQWGGQRHD